jgi:hypothetical protein
MDLTSFQFQGTPADLSPTVHAILEAVLALQGALGVPTPKWQTEGAAVPAVTDDSTDGYGVLSLWYVATGGDAGRLFWCADATEGAAVWNEFGAPDETWPLPPAGVRSLVSPLDRWDFATGLPVDWAHEQLSGTAPDPLSDIYSPTMAGPDGLFALEFLFANEYSSGDSGCLKSADITTGFTPGDPIGVSFLYRASESDIDALQIVCWAKISGTWETFASRPGGVYTCPAQYEWTRVWAELDTPSDAEAIRVCIAQQTYCGYGVVAQLAAYGDVTGGPFGYAPPDVPETVGGVVVPLPLETDLPGTLRVSGLAFGDGDVRTAWPTAGVVYEAGGTYTDAATHALTWTGDAPVVPDGYQCVGTCSVSGLSQDGDPVVYTVGAVEYLFYVDHDGGELVNITGPTNLPVAFLVNVTRDTGTGALSVEVSNSDGDPTDWVARLEMTLRELPT